MSNDHLLTDEELLGSVPDVLCISDMLKATPRMEEGQRVIYIEASNEAVDHQGEVVMSKALADSADYYLRHGNLDIDHYTLIGPRSGMKDANLYEIGRPLEVSSRDGKTFVKGCIYSGSGPAAEQANIFWSSLTDINPPQRWYPSVGGAIPPGGKVVDFDPVTQKRRVLVKATRWTNIGFSKTPVNPAVPTVSTVPFGALAKSWAAEGIDFLGMQKALTAGYGTDSASLTGGAALRTQSLLGAPITYVEFRDSMLLDLKLGAVGKNPNARQLVSYAASHYGIDPAQASEFVMRLLRADPQASQAIRAIHSP